jgi:5'-nucleotidase
VKIIVDIDGIVADTLPYWLDDIYKDTGVEAEEDDIHRWEMHKCHPLNQLALGQIYDRLQRPGFVANIPLMPWADGNLRDIQNDLGHTVMLVTARRGPVSMAETVTWCRTHLPWLPENRLIFAIDKSVIHADVIIDDRPENILDYLAAHPRATALTIGYRYNEHLPAHVKRFKRDGCTWANIRKCIADGTL